MSERNKSARGKNKSGVKNPLAGTRKTSAGPKPAAGTLMPNKYIDRLRWDDKAKMYTVIDLPKNVKKD